MLLVIVKHKIEIAEIKMKYGKYLSAKGSDLCKIIFKEGKKINGHDTNNKKITDAYEIIFNMRLKK